MTREEALGWARARLVGGESPAVDAQVLLMAATGCSRAQLLAFGEQPLGPEQEACFRAWVERRVLGEPVAHILGEREFFGLAFEVNAHTLIPRPDTETLVEAALERLPQTPIKALDLGTGSGAIAIALAHHRPAWRWLAVDFVAEAAALARRNAERLVPGRVEVRTGSWFEPVAGERFGLIVSNPPYIDPADPHLDQGDVRFEPKSALTAAEQGLADLRHIIMDAPNYLEAGGYLMLEHGYDQGRAVRELLLDRGFQAVETVRDLGQNERISLGLWPA
ncbi:peptide chain release factor N(5)-glutamine methyltransferase [Gallaecimonas sp. GXIMD4217]|uniref:peptide chain release factor N(5)-glutamine methyltransferase n=1 Tax=Gallaecimonas sp. GXIMD4217 TaxID=3131927 RepID=UPI00311B3168